MVSDCSRPASVFVSVLQAGMSLLLMCFCTVVSMCVCWCVCECVWYGV